MVAPRVDMDRLQELVRLHRMGRKAIHLARMLRMSPNTVRKYTTALDAAGLLAGDPEQLPELAVLKAAVAERVVFKTAPQMESTVMAWGSAITRMHDLGAGAQAIYDCLRLEHQDFTGTYSAVKRFCRRLKGATVVQAGDVAIPVETAPGQVAQVDFGYVGQLLDPATGLLRRVWAFVLVLGYSRHLVARLVCDQRVETWLQLHVEAFAELGGVPAVVVPDNLKAAVVCAAFSPDDQTGLQRSYRELARHYGFQVDPAPVRQPQKKGKVESAIKYLKRNFIAPRTFTDLDHARRELARWVVEVAGQRRHGRTGLAPLDVFTHQEQARLQPLPPLTFELVRWQKATVHRDGHVQLDKRLYSVPWPLIGQRLWVRATAHTVTIYHDDARIASHPRRGQGPYSTLDAHLPDHRRDYRHREPSYWLTRAAALGPAVAAYVAEALASGDPLSRLRLAQAVVTHLERVPVARAEAACARASYYGIYTLRGLKAILRDGLDLLPLPGASVPPAPAVVCRFARPVSDFVVLRQGGEP